MNLLQRIRMALAVAPFVAVLLFPELGQAMVGAQVVNLNDSGPGSLRAAIVNAGATDFISFDFSLSGKTIVLTSGEIVVDKNLTIDGSGLSQSVLISGNHNSRIFNVAAGQNVTLRTLTFVDGNGTPGGAIYSATGSTLSIANSTFIGNSALEGGAILNDGSLVLVQCTFSDNQAGYGGGLQCRGGAVVRQCTFSGNVADFGGGGIFNKGNTLVLENCIVAGNLPAVDGRDIYSQLAALVYVGANIVPFVFEDRPIAATFGPAPITSDPNLAPLGDYGGPSLTMPPLPGSPAIDAAASTIQEIQQVSVTYIDPGSFTLTFNGETTAPLPSSPSALDVQDVLNNLAGIAGAGGSVSVALTNNVYTITFNGALAGTDVSQLVVTPTPDVNASVSTLVNGARLPTSDQRGTFFARTVGAAPDLGAVEVQATPSAGAYNGLFRESLIRHESSGLFTATLSTSAKAPTDPKFSAKIFLAGKSYGFSGQFNDTGGASNSIPRRGLSPLTVQLFAANGNKLQGRISDGTWSADLTADRAMFNAKTNPATMAGNYTVHISGGADASVGPHGQGFGTVTVSSNGMVTLKGTLADGTPISQKSAVSRNLQWPLYAAGNGGQSSILGWVGFNIFAQSNFSGGLVWTKKPVATSKLYPAGFTNYTAIFGARYTRPPANTRILPVAIWQGIFDGGNFTNLAVPFTLDTKNKITAPADPTLSVKFVPSTGFFSGKITDRVTNKPVAFKGYVSQGNNICYGYFIDLNESCSVLLVPD